MQMTPEDYVTLAAHCFDPMYPGYNPQVYEVPNGDGKVDMKKKYSHIADKYLHMMRAGTAKQVLSGLLTDATAHARGVAVSMGVPREFWPHRRYSAIRILEYPVDGSSEKHTDFSLFSLPMFRSHLGGVTYSRPPLMINGEVVVVGELYELITEGKIQANPHSVCATPYACQYSIIFFAVPDHNQELPDGRTVGEFIEERIGRSRVELDS